MNVLRLAWQSLSGHLFRSLVVGLCALLVAAFALFATVVLRGAETALQLASDRLGADIVVVPRGAEARMEGALVSGVPAKFWMPSAYAEQLARVPGVEIASPQVYLATLSGASCCSAPNMFMVAYDPATDFVVRPWLAKTAEHQLRTGEVVGGSFISATEGRNNIRVYGYLVTLKQNLAPTGTGLDQSLFFTMDTARDIARISLTQAEAPLIVPDDRVSAVLLKLAPGAASHDVAVRILQQLPDVTPIEAADLFQASRKQLAGLSRTNLSILALTWGLSIVLIGLVFSMAANERRRELGVLRAIGARRSFVALSLLAEAGVLALVGAAVGIGLALLLASLFRHLIITTLGIPYLLPSPAALAGQIAAGLLLALLTVGLAALLPALKVARQDPAAAMRE